MEYVAAITFALCTWACFSKHVKDGFVIKHCLIFTALMAFIVVMQPDNSKAISFALASLSIAGVWFMLRSYRCLLKQVRVRQ